MHNDNAPENRGPDFDAAAAATVPDNFHRRISLGQLSPAAKRLIWGDGTAQRVAIS